MKQSSHFKVAMVCFIADPLDQPGHERFGGGHLFLYDLFHYLLESGIEVDFFTRRNSPEKELFEEIGPFARIYRLPVGKPEEMHPDLVSYLLEDLYQEFRYHLISSNSDYKVFHSHYWISGEITRRVASELGVRHIHSILSLGRVKRSEESRNAEVHKLRDACELAVFSCADALISVCPDEKESLLRLYPELETTTAVTIPYGVNLDVFYKRPEALDNFARRSALRLSKRNTDIH